MCCKSNYAVANYCACQKNAMNNPELWSKKKKIKILENHLLCLENQIIEVKEALEEQKA